MGPQAEQGDTLLGQTLSGKYRIISELGSGSMGTVYLGEHLGLKKKVALKILHPDLHVSDESLKRFQREGIAAGSFNHPNAIQIFDFDRAEGKHIYLALEFCEGQNLKVYLGESGPLSPLVAVRLIRQVLSTLAEAHAQGIVHRDLKPDNIMIVENAAGELTVKVLDFGLSKLVDRPLEASLQTQTGRIMGTPLYMSPEQWAGGDVDGRSDLYSAGLILYEMLSCHHPFRGSTITETMVKSTSQEAPSLADARPELKIPVGLVQVLDRAMQKRKADRYQSATQMIIDLDGVDFGKISKQNRSTSSQSAIKVSRSPNSSAAEDAPKRRGLLVAIAAFVLLGALIWAVFQFGGSLAGNQYPRVSMKSAEERTAEDTRYLNLLAEARAEFGQQRYVNALMKISAAKESPVADSEANLLSARINLGREEDISLARKDLEEALELDPDYAEARLELGWVEFAVGDMEAAELQFEAVSALANAAVSAEGGLGAIAYERQDYDGAEPLLSAGSQAANAGSREYLYLGRCQIALGSKEPAIESFIEAKRRDPSSWEAVSDLGEAYLRVGDMGKAETQLKQAIDLDAVRAIVAQGALASMLISQGRHEDAMLILDPAIQLHPNAGPLHILRGAALQGTGNRGEAIRSLEKGLANTQDAQAWILLGLLHQDAGNLDEATQAYNSALSVDGANAKALLQLGLVLFSQGKYERAGTRFQSAVDRDPGDAYARLCLAIYLMDFSEDPALARPHFEAYQALGGNDSRVVGWLNNLRD